MPQGSSLVNPASHSTMNFGDLDIDMSKIMQVARKCGIKRLYLFGSALRNDFSETSDIDFMVECACPEEPSLFDLFDLRHELEDMTGRNVDLVEKGAVRNPIRRESIQSSAVLVCTARF